MTRWLLRRCLTTPPCGRDMSGGCVRWHWYPSALQHAPLHPMRRLAFEPATPAHSWMSPCMRSMEALVYQ
jgi:hypothetical protein